MMPSDPNSVQYSSMIPPLATQMQTMHIGTAPSVSFFLCVCVFSVTDIVQSGITFKKSLNSTCEWGLCQTVFLKGVILI